MKFQVWIEGFLIQGMDRPVKARFLGEYKAESFKEACIQGLTQHNFSLSQWDENRMTHWGCGLFDNEEDARKSFG